MLLNCQDTLTCTHSSRLSILHPVNPVQRNIGQTRIFAVAHELMKGDVGTRGLAPTPVSGLHIHGATQRLFSACAQRVDRLIDVQKMNEESLRISVASGSDERQLVFVARELEIWIADSTRVENIII